MIKEVRRRYWSWRNTKWAKRHCDELYDKYTGSEVLISHCKVVDEKPAIWGAEFSKRKYAPENGDIEFSPPGRWGLIWRE